MEGREYLDFRTSDESDHTQLGNQLKDHEMSRRLEPRAASGNIIGGTSQGANSEKRGDESPIVRKTGEPRGAYSESVKKKSRK